MTNWLKEATMNALLIRLLACLSRATLDPGLGGRGMALSRLLSLAAHSTATIDPDGLRSLEKITAKIEGALSQLRHLTHEEWNELQSSAETGHWFLRAEFPQVSAEGQVHGGYKEPAHPPIEDIADSQHAEPYQPNLGIGLQADTVP
jgi:hypothetical protein